MRKETKIIFQLGDQILWRYIQEPLMNHLSNFSSLSWFSFFGDWFLLDFLLTLTLLMFRSNCQTALCILHLYQRTLSQFNFYFSIAVKITSIIIIHMYFENVMINNICINNTKRAAKGLCLHYSFSYLFIYFQQARCQLSIICNN